MRDFGNIIYRTDSKAYIINNGMLMVPALDDISISETIHAEFDDLYREISEYAALNPDKVTEESISVNIDLNDLKSTKLREINNNYNEATSTLVASYPQNELLTFDKQEAEARAWIADNAVETPLVDMLAAGRQIDKAELVNRIIAKADTFALAVGYLTGQRQRYEDMLDAATTVEEVEAIVPDYALPEGLSLGV